MQHERLLSFVPFDKLRAGSVGPIANSPVADLFSEVLSKSAGVGNSGPLQSHGTRWLAG
jgi:hypothetical protein